MNLNTHEAAVEFSSNLVHHTLDWRDAIDLEAKKIDETDESTQHQQLMVLTVR